MMNNKKVLITGGAGFVGSNLTKKILELYPSAVITVLDNFYTSDYDSVPGNANFINESTWDIENLFSSKEGTFDIVFHFGEYSRISSSFKDIDYVLKSNLHGTTRVIEMCRKWKAKLIYSASSSKFGNDGKDENLSPYAWVKAKGVELIKNYNEWYGLEYEICYFFNVYGPGQIQSGDYATVVGIFERQYSEGRYRTVVEPGTQTRDFTHIDDIVDGVIKATNSYKNGEWHLRSGETYSIIELANMFNVEWKLIPSRKGERKYVVDIETNTQSELGWDPANKLSDYINNVISDEEISGV